MADAGTPSATPTAPAVPAATPAATPTPAPTGESAPAAPSATPATTPIETSTPPPAESTQIETAEWMKVYSPEAQEVIKKNNWKDANEVIKSYTELRAKIAEKGIQAPGENATQTEWDAYYKALGRPDKAAEYSFTLPTDIPPDLPYDAKFADSFKNWAHEAGLTKAQADKLHNKYLNHFAGEVKEVATSINNKIQTSHAELVKSWGPPGTESYNKNVEMATRAVRNLDPGLAASLKANNLLSPDGTVLDATVAKALAKVGTELYSEDGLYGANQLASEQNPWTKGKENLTRQGEIYKQDPERARQMQRAAGLKVTL